ncbi:MAG: response regulator transcription factor [Chloroflexi bacterium]|nr:response regulator transcription factor [Chloroflexota bacterium]
MTVARVLVISPLPAVRAGLAMLLQVEAGHEVVGQEASLAALDQLPPDRAPEVVVVAPESADEMDALLEHAATDPALRVVVLGPVAGDERLGEVFAARPWAYVPRDASGEELGAAVAAVARGLIALHPGLALRLAEAGSAPLPGGPATPGADLTPREREVLHLVAQGLPNKAIAAHLGISEHTVKFHVASVLAKLGAASRAEAVRLGARRGLIVL